MNHGEYELGRVPHILGERVEGQGVGQFDRTVRLLAHSLQVCVAIVTGADPPAPNIVELTTVIIEVGVDEGSHSHPISQVGLLSGGGSKLSIHLNELVEVKNIQVIPAAASDANAGSIKLNFKEGA